MGKKSFEEILEETAEMMFSEDYKERFKAEYYQILIRAVRLNAMLCCWDNGEPNFEPACPKSTYKMQFKAMMDYINILEARAAIEKIDLEYTDIRRILD